MHTDAHPDGSAARLALGRCHASGRRMERWDYLHTKFTGPARGNSWLRFDQPMSSPDAAVVYLADSSLFTEHAGSIFSSLGVKRLASLEELFVESDVVVDLAAATPENYHVVTESHLRMIPKGGMFVNVGRGCVVDQDGLLRVAREGQIGRAHV